MNLSFVWAELSRRPARTLAGLLSVAVGVALSISLGAYAGAYRQAARVPLAEIGANIVTQRQGPVPKAFQGIVLPRSTAPIHRSEVDTGATGGLAQTRRRVSQKLSGAAETPSARMQAARPV